jgi:hypothetical protein
MSAEFDRLLPVLVQGGIVKFKCVDLPTLVMSVKAMRQGRDSMLPDSRLRSGCL